MIDGEELVLSRVVGQRRVALEQRGVGDRDDAADQSPALFSRSPKMFVSKYWRHRTRNSRLTVE